MFNHKINIYSNSAYYYLSENIGSLKEVITYAPEVADIYEGNTISDIFNYDGLENQMEGKHRPGHFDGVGTIVKRLLLGDFQFSKSLSSYPLGKTVIFFALIFLCLAANNRFISSLTVQIIFALISTSSSIFLSKYLAKAVG